MDRHKDCSKCPGKMNTLDNHDDCYKHRRCNEKRPCSTCRLWTKEKWKIMNKMIAKETQKQDEKYAKRLQQEYYDEEYKNSNSPAPKTDRQVLQDEIFAKQLDEELNKPNTRSNGRTSEGEEDVMATPGQKVLLNKRKNSPPKERLPRNGDQITRSDYSLSKQIKGEKSDTFLKEKSRSDAGSSSSTPRDTAEIHEKDIVWLKWRGCPVWPAVVRGMEKRKRKIDKISLSMIEPHPWIPKRLRVKYNQKSIFPYNSKDSDLFLDEGNNLEGEARERFTKAVDTIENYMTKRILGTLRKEDMEFMDCHEEI